MYLLQSTFCALSLITIAQFVSVNGAVLDKSESRAVCSGGRVSLASLSAFITRAQDTSRIGEAPSPPLEVEPWFDERQLYSLLRCPEEAQRNNLEGKVIVRVFLDSTGTITTTRFISSSDKLFEQPVLDAIKGTRFTRAFINGKPISAWLEIPITFKLGDPNDDEKNEAK